MEGIELLNQETEHWEKNKKNLGILEADTIKQSMKEKNNKRVY